MQGPQGGALAYIFGPAQAKPILLRMSPSEESAVQRTAAFRPKLELPLQSGPLAPASWGSPSLLQLLLLLWLLLVVPSLLLVPRLMLQDILFVQACGHSSGA